ncbi:MULTISPECIES: DUF1853 family protein [Tenacibaculum]|uniref:DUF1853 family protein n=1 Tax=Tenacibaculum TaxID=104267 RepID=UPI001F0B1338|nr:MULTISPECIES: DUF1853 family protein [Tenacibaculum]MCH3882125.1 DUF1853 family protein [Tenacibaculum aquimarinum]MDO6599765.1 DUF1853 family protein [Tenacibaculum sp. 1_MG-2023]
MYINTKELQLQYQGFLETPFLWNGKGVFGFKQFEYKQLKTNFLNVEIQQKLRLGKLVERFVSFEFKQNSEIQILAENIQIQKDKITLGELDCLLLRNEKTIHLEIIYKFYLYDAKLGTTEIEHFIGPNRKDSLTQKLTKLKEKQLPLLYSNECKTYLESINLDVFNIEQQVYFKAQLFVPYANFKLKLNTLNQSCVVGFYIKRTELLDFSTCKFHIPKKNNWLVEPHKNINWLKFDEFSEKLDTFLIDEKSPLCWLKKANGVLYKIFIVWW